MGWEPHVGRYSTHYFAFSELLSLKLNFALQRLFERVRALWRIRKRENKAFSADCTELYLSFTSALNVVQWTTLLLTCTCTARAVLLMPSWQHAAAADWTARVLVMYSLGRLLSSRQTFVIFSGDCAASHLQGRLSHFCALTDRSPCTFLVHQKSLLLTHISPLLEISIQIRLKWRKGEEEQLLARAVLWVRGAYVSVQFSQRRTFGSTLSALQCAI